MNDTARIPNTAWDWKENEKRPLNKRKVHALLSTRKEIDKDSGTPSYWEMSDDKTLKDLFELHREGNHIATGHREEWNLKAHEFGAGHTYFLGVIVDNWEKFTMIPRPESVEEYLALLPDETINEIAWVSETYDSNKEQKKYQVIFNFSKLIEGRVIQEAFHYLSFLPGFRKLNQIDTIPRLIMGNSGKESKWIGGTVSAKTCNEIIEKAKQNSSITTEQEKEIPTKAIVANTKLLDLNTDKIDGLVNYKFPVKQPDDKNTIIEAAGLLHGKASINWNSDKLTVKEWVEKLNKGFHIAPGTFEYSKPDESKRSAKAFQYTNLILLDVDEWEDGQAPATIDEWMSSLHSSIASWITWVGESASSRTNEKPELRLRVAVAFERAIPGDYFVQLAQYLHQHIPGTALRVAKDKVRLSYGNGRVECNNEWYGGMLPKSIIDQVMAEAHESVLEKERELAERRQFNEEEKQRRKESGFHQEDAPWDAFDLDPVSYLEGLGYTRLNDIGGEWVTFSRPDGKIGNPSLGIIKGEKHWTISCFSTSVSMPGNSVSSEGITATCSFLEFYCYNTYNLDITGGLNGPNSSNFKIAMEYLSKAGYGNWGSDFQKQYKEAVADWQLEKPADPELNNKDENGDPIPYWDIEQNKLPHNYLINRNYYTEPKGEPEALSIAQNYKIAWLDGPPGVAKTTFQLAHARLLEDTEIKLVAGPRKILSSNLAAYLNDQLNYEGPEDQNIAMQMPVKYIHGDVKLTGNWHLPQYMLTSTIHSMLRSLRILNKAEISEIHLALDEIDFIIQAFYSPQLHGKTQEILDEIAKYAERNTVFITGATASTGLILEFVRALGFTEDDVCQISIEREAPKGGNLKFAKVKMKEVIDTIANAVETLEDGVKIFVGFADKEYAKTLRDHPKIQARGKVQMVTSENSQNKDIQKLLTESSLEEMNIDVLIVSPSIDVGVNLFGSNTQVIIVRAATFGAPVKTSWQQARRVRNTQRPIWYISAEIDWTRSLTLEELKLHYQEKVRDVFVRYIGNPRTATDVEDSAIFAELNAVGKKGADKLKNLSVEELLDADYLNAEQKKYLRDALNRSQLQARVEWEAEQELLFEQDFIEYHSQREGMDFELWTPEAPTIEQIKNTSHSSATRKKEERIRHDNAVIESLVEGNFTSLEQIESKRKSAEYENNEYEVAIDVNNRLQKVGVPDILLDDTEIREEDVQRAIGMMEAKIKPEDFQRKFEIYEALTDPEAANDRFYWKASKDLNTVVCKPIQAILLKYIDDHLTYMGANFVEVFYREILHLAEQKILLNNKGVEVERTLTDAIFIHFPDKLRSYRRMRRYGTSQAKALYTLFNKLLKQYLHRGLEPVGEKAKKREVQDLPNKDLLIQYFQEVGQTEKYYKSKHFDISVPESDEEPTQSSAESEILNEIQNMPNAITELPPSDYIEDYIDF